MKSALLFAAACLAFASIEISAASTHYVDAGGANPVSPYTNWSTAATSIQDAVDVSTNGDTVLVTNGVYQTGGSSYWVTTYYPNYSVATRVVVTKAITVRSVNGPAQTVIVGNLTDPTVYQYTYQVWSASVRCVLLTNGATLDGFTLTNGYSAGGGGGGVSSSSTNSMITNCIITHNTVDNYGGGGGAFSGTLNNCVLIANHDLTEGGGAASSVLNNCLLVGNIAAGGGGGSGGGAYSCVLNNCTIVTNLASADGGGVSGCTLNNCIVYDNIAAWLGQNYDPYWVSSFNYCCTTPMPTNGWGNITNDPAFVNLTNGDFHLQAISRCINAGINSSVVGSTDLDGNPRIMGDTVDMGAYEFQAQVAGTFSSWLQQYNLPTDGSADSVDSDGDGMVNWQEWIAGTIPNNRLSVLAMTSAASTNGSSGITVSWQSVRNRTYYLQRASDLAVQPAFSAIQSNIVGQAGTTSYTDLSTKRGVPYFYRVGVQ